MSEDPKQQWTSYSGLTKHRQCPAAWTYSSLRGLEQIPADSKAVDMWFGTWWHALRAADDITKGNRVGTLVKAPETLSVPGLPHDRSYGDGWKPEKVPSDTTPGGILDYVGVWWAAQDDATKDAWMKVYRQEPQQRLVYVDEQWHERWDEENEYEQPLAVEVRWSRSLPAVTMPDGSKVDPATTLVGYIDEVYYDRKRGLVVARDRKTHGEIPNASALDDMTDSQLMLYAWGGAQVIGGFGRGQIRAIGYDRVRGPASKTPVLTKSGKLSATITDFDARTYREWAAKGQEYPGLKADGSGAGVYQMEPDVLAARLTPAAWAKWFDRSLTPLNMNVLRAHLRAAADTALDQRLTRERVAVEGMAARNFTWSCRRCEFVGLCRVEMFGGVEGDYDLAEFGLRKKPSGKC